MQLFGFCIIFAMIVIVGAGNAVNMTDGLDGLAIVPVMIAAGTFGVSSRISSAASIRLISRHLHVAGVGELSTLLGALLGASPGFLGTMRRPRVCSWAIPARSRSAACSARWL